MIKKELVSKFVFCVIAIIIAGVLTTMMIFFNIHRNNKKLDEQNLDINETSPYEIIENDIKESEDEVFEKEKEIVPETPTEQNNHDSQSDVKINKKTQTTEITETEKNKTPIAPQQEEQKDIDKGETKIDNSEEISKLNIQILEKQNNIDYYNNKITEYNNSIKSLTITLNQHKINLQQAQVALENARKEKNVKVWREGKGFVYEADPAVISRAEQNVNFYEGMVNDYENMIVTQKNNITGAQNKINIINEEIKILKDKIEKLN